ncbi:MAG: lipocalin family protein [Planctomycetota bacterium]|nr:lipocalin family protein [Planctomycetota bacterium]
MKHSIPFIALALVAALLFPACGDKAGGGGGGGGGSIEGTWQLDTSALKDFMMEQMDKEFEGKSDQEKAMMKAMIEPMLAAFEKAEMTVEIKGDGTWTGKSKFPEGPGGELKLEESNGTWTLDGDKLTVVSTHEDGKEKAEADTLTGTWNGDEITVKDKDDPNSPTMVMRRK